MFCFAELRAAWTRRLAPGVPFLPAVVAASLAWSSLSAQERPDRGGRGIVAVAGDMVITQKDLDLAVEMLRIMGYPPAAIARNRDYFERQELQRLIDEKLILQAVKREEEKAGTPYITEPEIDEELRRNITRLKEAGHPVKDPDDVYQFFRDGFGLRRSEYRRLLMEQMAWNKFIAQKVRIHVPRFVSPAEQKSYYRRHLDEFTTPAQISFRQIVIYWTRIGAAEIGQRVYTGLKSGEAFEDLARSYSQEAVGGDPEAATRVWKKSFEELKTWHPPIPQVLSRMKEGEISPPVDTRVGRHFFKVLEVVQGTPLSFGEAQELIERKLRRERNRRAELAYLTKLRKQNRIEIFVPRLRDDAVASIGEASDKEEPSGPEGESPASAGKDKPASKNESGENGTPPGGADRERDGKLPAAENETIKKAPR